MAIFRKLSSGKWQAQIARKGVRKSASFETKHEAKDWVARREYLATDDDLPKTELTLKDAFERYAREGSPKRGGERWEVIRLARSMRDPIAAKSLVGLEPSDLAQWRDCRLQQVSPGTVRREMALLSSVLATARREWGLIAHNLMADTGKPPSPPARDRRVRDGEIRKLVATA